MNKKTLLLGVLIAAALAACEGSSPPTDAGELADAGDAGTPRDDDAGTDASRPRDAAPDAPMDDAQVGMDDAQVMMDDGGVDGGGSCTTNDECQNADLCDGEEICVDGECAPATAPLECDDGQACTTDSCDAVAGCVGTQLDSDSDGDGDCGDCAPTNPAIHAGATELCNAIDDNCNGATDEGASTTNYSDCDGDGWASLTAVSSDGCTPPPVSDTGCGTATQAWTTRATSETDFDCADDDTRAHSGATAFEATAIASAPSETDFDFDCDFVETMELTTSGGCSGGVGACTPVMGWLLATVPDCGETGLFITGCTAACTPTTATRTQRCR